jgi:glycogen debranching enzyme
MLETITAQKRPRVQYAWRGPSLLKIDDEGWAGTDLWQAAMWDRGEMVGAILPTANRLQGTKVDDTRAEQPGRIVRQHRRDPRSRLGETPFDRFYADFASPFMFVISLGNSYAWSGERALLARHYDACRKVLDWAKEYGDRDGDGYVEYKNPSEQGPPHEGWKDAGNAVVYEDGRQVEPPIAPAEIQGYWYAALQFTAVFSAIVGSKEDALAYWREAKELKQRFNRDFWVDEARWSASAARSRTVVCRCRPHTAPPSTQSRGGSTACAWS